MNWLRELFTSSYTRLLEEENARLRAENRAMINSLLGVAGHSPVDFAGIPVRTDGAKPRRNPSLHQQQRMTEAESERRVLARAQHLQALEDDADRQKAARRA